MRQGYQGRGVPSTSDLTPLLSKELLYLFPHPGTRWYSLHGVDLLPTPLSRSLRLGFTREDTQRLFTFTGNLARHRAALGIPQRINGGIEKTS
jgi:hypothetical protein